MIEAGRGNVWKVPLKGVTMFFCCWLEHLFLKKPMLIECLLGGVERRHTKKAVHFSKGGLAGMLAQVIVCKGSAGPKKGKLASKSKHFRNVATRANMYGDALPQPVKWG